jgi:hypothetical protein
METVNIDRKTNVLKRTIDSNSKKLNVIDNFFNDNVLVSNKETYQVESENLQEIKDGVSLIKDTRLKTLCELSVTNSTKRKLTQALKETTQ